MNPREFIFFASKLAAAPASGSPGFRSAVSRAYYGAFHLAKDLLEIEMGFNCRTGGNEHLFIQQLFLNCDVADGEEIGLLLGNLHQSRKEADYDLDEPHGDQQANARQCVERATELARKLDECALSPVRDTVQAGISKYRALTS